MTSSVFVSEIHYLLHSVQPDDMGWVLRVGTSWNVLCATENGVKPL